MAQAPDAAHGSADHGSMEIQEQRGTFSAFLSTSLWGSTMIAQSVALLVLAFAIGAGWWAGLAAWVVIGVGVGLFFRMSGAWWAYVIASTIVLGIGGAIVSGLVALMG